MGLTQTNVSEDNEENYEDNSPVVETGYYWGELKSANYYTKEGEQKIVLNFEVETEVEEETVSVEVPYFAFAKVSCYAKKDADYASSSNLGHILETLGGAEVFDEYVDADGAVASGDVKYIVEPGNEDEQEEFRNALKAAMAGKEYKLNVKKSEETDDEGNVKTDDEGNIVYSNIIAEIDEFRSSEDSDSDGDPVFDEDDPEPENPDEDEDEFV